jgi:uncharacterized membrane protein required for colicin V production
MHVPFAIDRTRAILGLLTAADVVVIVALLVSVGFGFWTGLVWQGVRLAGVAVSLWVAWLYHPALAGMLSGELVRDAPRLTAFAAIFFGMLLLCYLLSYLCRDALSAIRSKSEDETGGSALKLADRVMGAVFGLVKATLVVGAVAFLALSYADEGSIWHTQIRRSNAAVATALCAEAFLRWTPPSVRRKVVGAPPAAAPDTSGTPSPARPSGPV